MTYRCLHSCECVSYLLAGRKKGTCVPPFQLITYLLFVSTTISPEIILAFKGFDFGLKLVGNLLCHGIIAIAYIDKAVCHVGNNCFATLDVPFLIYSSTAANIESPTFFIIEQMITSGLMYFWSESTPVHKCRAHQQLRKRLRPSCLRFGI